MNERSHSCTNGTGGNYAHAVLVATAWGKP